jgi:hypothetical protein
MAGLFMAAGGTVACGLAFGSQEAVMRKTILAVLCIVCLPIAASAQSLDWTRYSLGDGTAAVDLPVGVFATDSGPSKNGTGHTFTTTDGRADVSVYSITNQPPRSPAQFLAQDFQLPQSSAIYRRVTGNMLAVSGYRGDQIWYARCNFGRQRLHCVALNYPASEKRQWDAIVTRISNSLSRAG